MPKNLTQGGSLAASTNAGRYASHKAEWADLEPREPLCRICRNLYTSWCLYLMGLVAEVVEPHRRVEEAKRAARSGGCGFFTPLGRG